MSRLSRILILLFPLLLFAAPAVAQSLAPPGNFRIDAATGIASWEAIDNATGYELELRVGLTGDLVTLTPGKVLEVDFKTAPKATNCCVKNEQYTVKIRALRASKNTAWTTLRSFIFTGDDIAASPVPFSLTAAASYDYGAGTIWLDISSNKFISVSCTLNGAAVGCPIGRTGFVRAASAAYTIVVSTTFNSQAYSKEASIVVPASAPTFSGSAPANVRIDADKDTIAWDAISNAPHYLIKVVQGATTELNTSSASIDLSAPLADTAATITVKACTDTTGSLCGATATLEIADENAPAVNLTAPANLRIAADRQTVRWNAVTGAAFYAYFYFRDGAPILNDKTSSTTFTLASAIPQSSFARISVKACADEALSNCSLSATVTIQPAGGDRPNPQPDSGRSSGSSSSGSKRERDPAAPAARDASRLPIPAQDHSQLPAGAEVNSDKPWIQFREVSRAGIGRQSVLDRGARSAIDVWGPMGVEAEVCFAGRGSLLLLDAAYSPRLEVPLVSYLRGGKTCAQFDRAGTVVLMPGEPTYTLPPTATQAPSAPLAPTAAATQARDPHLIRDSLDTMVSLENCQVGSLFILNLRESPAGPVMRWFNGISPALARTANWFQVVDQGELGWVSAHFVNSAGDCG